MIDTDAVFDDVVTVVREISRGQGQWAVLGVADANGELMKVVGTSLGRFGEPGRQIRVQGRWKDHPVHGRQLHAHRASPELACAVAPPDIHALLRRVPHIGDKRAQLLIDRYGVDAVLNSVDANPRQAFIRVAGLPHQHASDAARWWREQRTHPAARNERVR